MISVKGLCKRFRTINGRKTVFEGLNLNIKKGDKIGLLGRNGCGKTTLINIIGGVEPYDRGEVVKKIKTSWPVGFRGSIQNDLSGLDNLKFISRVYGKDYQRAKKYVTWFTGIDEELKERVSLYSSGMKAKLVTAMAAFIGFNCYLIDEITAVGDKDFQKKFKSQILKDETTLIFASHVLPKVKRLCDRFVVIQNKKIIECKNFEEAKKLYEKS